MNNSKLNINHKSKNGDNKKPKEDFISLLSSPARRALENKGINTLQQLSMFSEAEILKLHGMGPGSMPKLLIALEAQKLSFKD